MNDLEKEVERLRGELVDTHRELGEAWEALRAVYMRPFVERVRELKAEQRRYYEESCDLAVQKGDQRQRAEKAETRCAEMRAALEGFARKGCLCAKEIEEETGQPGTCVTDSPNYRKEWCWTCLARAALEEREEPRVRPCGCVVCICADEDRCHGCGAKLCAEHRAALEEKA